MRERNPFNAREATIEVVPGRLVMFPSWLTHSVPLNRGDQERISISFNVMFSDYLRLMSKPKWHGIQRP